MKFAWIESGKVRDVCPGDPASSYTPDIAAHYSTVVPDAAAIGDGWDGTTLTKPTPVSPPAPAPIDTVLSRVQFMLRFTAAERVVIRAAVAKGDDFVLIDWWEILHDPQFEGVHTASAPAKQALGYLVAKGLLDASRVAAILA